MHDPAKAAGNKTTVATILTRADHGNSEDGVLGMSLQPDFDLADPDKRNLFVYYSPRNAAWPTSGNVQVVGYNQISRFTFTADGTAVVPDSERVILRVPKAKIAGSPSGFAGGPTDSGPGHVGGAGLDFDSEGNLYLGVGDDVVAERAGPQRLRADGLPLRGALGRTQDVAELGRPARQDHPHQADLGDIPADAKPGAEHDVHRPGGQPVPGRRRRRPAPRSTRWASVSRSRSTPTRPSRAPWSRASTATTTAPTPRSRSPAGTCEWNLLNKPGNHGWPLCVGDNSPALSMFKWNYAANASTGQQYDCNAARSRPTSARHPPVRRRWSRRSTVWTRCPARSRRPRSTRRPTTSGQRPLTSATSAPATTSRSPARSTATTGTVGRGAFPAYYDGSWFINNRGTENGFWKEVKLRKDNNEMLRVQDWLPWNGGVNPSGANSSLVIGTQFSPDGNLYMSRYSTAAAVTAPAPQQNQIVKISFNVQDECLTDTNAPNASAT